MSEPMPWNESNPEWWQAQVEEREKLGREIVWAWLVNEWAQAVAAREALGDLVAQCEHQRFQPTWGPLMEYEITKARAALGAIETEEV